MSDVTSFDSTRPLPVAGSDVEAARKALTQALSQFLDRPRVDLALQLWRRRYEGDDSLFLRLTFYCREIAQQHGLVGQEASLHNALMQALQRSLQMSAATSTVNFDATAPMGFDAWPKAAQVSVSTLIEVPARKRAEPVLSPALLPALNGREAPQTDRMPESDRTGQPNGRDAQPERRATQRQEPVQDATVVPARSPEARVLQAFYMALEAQLARQLPPGVTPARVRRTLIRHARALPHEQRHPVSLWWSGQVRVLEGSWPIGGAGSALVQVMNGALTELLGPAHAERCFRQAVTRLEASRDSALHRIRRYL